MGITGQDGQQLACAQANTDVEHPDEAVRKGRLTQGQAPTPASRFDAHYGESHDPVDDGLRAWRSLDAKSPGEETQDARDGAKADTRYAKELQGQEDQVHLGQGDESLRLALELTQTRLSRVEGFGGSVALGGYASDLFALVSISVTSLRGFVFPLISTVCDFGELTHRVRLSSPMAVGARGRLGLR
jgi:hypothetical protein